MKSQMGILVGGLLVIAAPVYAAFVEDWSTLSNGTGNRLSSEDASLAGWTFNGAKLDCYTESAGMLRSVSGKGTVADRTAGKLHGQNVAAATSVDLSFELKMTKGGAVDSEIGMVDIWLSGEFQNGYGLRMTRSFSENNAQAVAFFGSNAPFGSKRSGGVLTSDTATYSTAGLDSFYTVNLRIEQDRAGASVMMTVWTNEGSYDSPLLTWTDDSEEVDLSQLTYVALALDRSNSPKSSTVIDNISVSTIPETVKMGLVVRNGSF